MPVKWVESLLALQAVDLRIRELEQRVALLPQEMNRLKAKRDEAVARVNAVADKGRKIDLERKSAESEIAKLNAENEKLRQQSAMVRKNSEYQAMLNTIAMNKKYIGDLETRVLGLMDDFEAARREYRKVKLESEIEVKGAREEFDELVAFSKDVKRRSPLSPPPARNSPARSTPPPSRATRRCCGAKTAAHRWSRSKTASAGTAICASPRRR